MVRKVTNRLYKVNTYAGHLILEVDDSYDKDVQDLRQNLELDCLGYNFKCHRI